MALGHLPCLQEINISASGKMIYKTGMAFRLGLTTVYTRASYLKPKSKAKAIWCGATAINTTDKGLTIQLTDMDISSGLMAKYFYIH